MQRTFVVMNEDFVPFEIAQKLKEKGFPQHITDEAYIVDNYGEDECDIGERLPIPLIPDYMDDVAAPTISQVLKWLREEKKIEVVVFGQDYIGGPYFADVFTKDGPMNKAEPYPKYEQAALAGIEYVLDNLI